MWRSGSLGPYYATRRYDLETDKGNASQAFVNLRDRPSTNRGALSIPETRMITGQTILASFFLVANIPAESDLIRTCAVSPA